MRLRRAELRDDLAAIIAASRELSPEYDQALAELLLDRVEDKRPRIVRAPKTRRPSACQRLAAAACLLVAGIFAGELISSHASDGTTGVAQPFARAGGNTKFVQPLVAKVNSVGKAPANFELGPLRKRLHRIEVQKVIRKIGSKSEK